MGNDRNAGVWIATCIVVAVLVITVSAFNNEQPESTPHLSITSKEKTSNHNDVNTSDRKDSGSKVKSNTNKITKSSSSTYIRKKATKREVYHDTYEDGYVDVYFDEDYDTDRYDEDPDYVIKICMICQKSL